MFGQRGCEIQDEQLRDRLNKVIADMEDSVSRQERPSHDQNCHSSSAVIVDSTQLSEVVSDGVSDGVSGGVSDGVSAGVSGGVSDGVSAGSKSSRLQYRRTSKYSQISVDDDFDLSTPTNDSPLVNDSKTPADMSRAIPAKLLQPAQDSVMIQPNRKAMFVDSAFFSASMHPTWEQQVHLARRISVSLSDVNNRQSRGQCMYEQRKRRSDKWVHQENKSLTNITRSGGQERGENGEQCNHQPSQTKPLTKLLTNPHGNVYDMKALAQDEWISSDKGVMSPEVCSGLLKDLSSPLCKGAQIFAKRKKRSEKWVVDEMNREVRREDNCPPVRASNYDVTCKPLVSIGPHMPQQQTASNPPQQPPSAPHNDGKRLGRSATFNTNWCNSSSSRHPVVRASIMQSRPQYHCNDHRLFGGDTENNDSTANITSESRTNNMQTSHEHQRTLKINQETHHAQTNTLFSTARFAQVANTEFTEAKCDLQMNNSLQLAEDEFTMAVAQLMKKNGDQEHPTSSSPCSPQSLDVNNKKEPVSACYTPNGNIDSINQSRPLVDKQISPQYGQKHHYELVQNTEHNGHAKLNDDLNESCGQLERIIGADKFNNNDEHSANIATAGPLNMPPIASCDRSNDCLSTGEQNSLVKRDYCRVDEPSSLMFHCDVSLVQNESNSKPSRLERTTTDVQQSHSSRPGLNYDTTTKCHHQNSAVLKRQSWCNYNTAASGWNAHRDVYQPVTFM